MELLIGMAAETAKLFSKVVAQFYISTSNVWAFYLLHILLTPGIAGLFNIRHLSGSLAVSRSGFNLHFCNA